MTPKNPQNLHTPKNIHFSENPQNIEILNFEPPKNDPSLRIYENIRVPPPPWELTVCPFFNNFTYINPASLVISTRAQFAMLTKLRRIDHLKTNISYKLRSCLKSEFAQL